MIRNQQICIELPNQQVICAAAEKMKLSDLHAIKKQQAKEHLPSDNRKLNPALEDEMMFYLSISG
jgi:hypothetical protein